MVLVMLKILNTCSGFLCGVLYSGQSGFTAPFMVFNLWIG